MIPFMIPTEKKYDLNQIDSMISGAVKITRTISVMLTESIAEDGFGRVTIDGKEAPRPMEIMALGFRLLLISVGEIVREYDRTYTVRLEGFRAKNGMKFPACQFQLKTHPRRKQDPAYVEHDTQALNAAREGMVLLKNEGNVLPLKPNSVLNCFGTGQHMFRITATGASYINPRWCPNFMEAVADHSGFIVNEELSEFYRKSDTGVPDPEMLLRAKEKSDTAIIFLTRHSGEMQDNRPVKGQYYLTDTEKEMVETVVAAFSKTVLILNVGHPIEMRWTQELGISSIIYTGFSGMLASYALVEILDGRTNPSGRLPDTLVWDIYDSPVAHNQPALGGKDVHLLDAASGVRIYYEEDIYVGYRYFDTFGKPVAFPFGYGLSYTSFEKKVSCFCCNENGVSLDVTVTNRGSVPGKEVVQLYVSAPDGKLEKPAHVLVGFDKTRLLAPGESETLHLTANNKEMASFDEETASWLLEQGEYTVSVGEAGNFTEVGRFVLEKTRVLSTVRHYGCPVEDFKRLTKADPTVDGSKSRLVPLEERFAVKAERKPYHPEPLPEYKDKTITWPELQKNPQLLDSFVSQMTMDELASLNVCAGSRWMPWQDGAAGSTFAIKKYRLPVFSVSDANAGLNLKKPNIGFPASSVIAATFNKEIAYTVGRVIAEESLENGISLNLGPGMNLHRSYLNGRHPEYFSEDPFLTGTMAGHHGRGLEENGVGCCYKHLFCNNSDLARKGSHSVVSERALRELYLRSFEIAFEIHKPSAVMTSYNAMNGLYPAENADLLQGLVRQEWGFDGFIMSDWDTYETVDAVEMVKAGNCWITAGGPKWVKMLQKAAKEGKVPRTVLENNVRWLMKVMLKWK